MADEDGRTTRSGVPGATETFRRLQELGTQLASAAQSMAEEFTRSASPPFAEPMARLGARVAETSMLWVTPVREMLQQQQELVETMAKWAEQQRELADRLAAVAERQRAMTERLQSLVMPGLEAIEEVRESVHNFTSRGANKPPS